MRSRNRPCKDFFKKPTKYENLHSKNILSVVGGNFPLVVTLVHEGWPKTLLHLMISAIQNWQNWARA